MKTRLLLLSLLVSLAGCRTFNSNVDKTAIPKFERILTVSILPISYDEVAIFRELLPAPYTVCVVETGQLALANPDSLIRREAKKCNSQVMLTISSLRDHLPTASFAGYSRMSSESALEIVNLADGKPFWKGIMETGGRSYKIMPARILKKLKEDGIILTPTNSILVNEVIRQRPKP